MLELSSYIAKDLNLKNDFRLKILVRFTTENCSVSSKQNAYGFKYNFFCFLMKELASFCEAKKKKNRDAFYISAIIKWKNSEKNISII